jgi:hypothetical protein
MENKIKYLTFSGIQHCFPWVGVGVERKVYFTFNLPQLSNKRDDEMWGKT